MTTTRAQRVTFPGSQGATLDARLDLPAGPAHAYALFAHCFTCSKDLFAASRIAAELTTQGIAVLRFDFTGLGSSDGEFANTNFASNLDDLRAAAAWLREHHRAPQLLIGHSLGGAATLAVRRDIPEVKAVAVVGAPASPEHVKQLFTGRLTELERDGEVEVSIAGRLFLVRRQLIDDLAQHPLLDHMRTLHAALLVLHSPIDNTVGIENAAEIYQAARHPKSFVSLDGADHLLTRRSDAEFAARMIGTWAGRYLRDEAPLTPAPKATAPVVVAEAGQGTFLNHVVVGEHRFLADEPESAGGFDAGPSPYDLLSAALGACTSMTLRLYASRKQLPLERVIVEVNHAKVHADDCADCADGQTRLIDRFERSIRVVGPLSDDQRADLVRIASRCPVHRTLESTSQITTALADDEI